MLIENTDNKYSVSNTGEVTSYKYNSPRILKQLKHTGGYLQVCLRVNNVTYNRYVHRLVACTYIPNPNNLPQVNHKDGNKTNNNVTNLEWVTAKENLTHAVETGLGGMTGVKGKDNPRSLKVNQLSIQTGEVIATYDSVNQVRRELGFAVSDALRRRTGHNRCKGFLWDYA